MATVALNPIGGSRNFIKPDMSCGDFFVALQAAGFTGALVWAAVGLACFCEREEVVNVCPGATIVLGFLGLLSRGSMAPDGAFKSIGTPNVVSIFGRLPNMPASFVNA